MCTGTLRGALKEHALQAQCNAWQDRNIRFYWHMAWQHLITVHWCSTEALHHLYRFHAGLIRAWCWSVVGERVWCARKDVLCLNKCKSLVVLSGVGKPSPAPALIAVNIFSALNWKHSSPVLTWSFWLYYFFCYCWHALLPFKRLWSVRFLKKDINTVIQQVFIKLIKKIAGKASCKDFYLKKNSKNSEDNISVFTKISMTTFSPSIIIRNVFWQQNQHIIRISERSCDNEDWNNGCKKINFSTTGIYDISKYIKTGKEIVNCCDISPYNRFYCVFNQNQPRGIRDFF